MGLNGRTMLLAGALHGGIGVIVSALAAHAVEPEAGQLMTTAAIQQLVHALALITLSRFPSIGHSVRFAGFCFALGALVFCGTVYAIALGAPRFFSYLAPLGGALLIAGWGALILAALRWRN